MHIVTHSSDILLLYIHLSSYDSWYGFYSTAYMTGAIFHSLSRRIIGGYDTFDLWLKAGAKDLMFDVLVRNDGFGSMFFLDEANPLHFTSSWFGKNKVRLGFVIVVIMIGVSCFHNMCCSCL